MDNDNRKKKRNLEDRGGGSPGEDSNEISKEVDRSPRQRRRSSSADSSSLQPQQHSLTAFLADEHQRSRQAYESEFQREMLFEQHAESANSFQAQQHNMPYPTGRSGEEMRGMGRQFPSSRRGSAESMYDRDIFASTDGDDASSPRFDPSDLSWAEAERKLEYDISSIQPLPILPPFDERRLLPLDRLLDPFQSAIGPRERSTSSALSSPRESSDQRDRSDSRERSTSRAGSDPRERSDQRGPLASGFQPDVRQPQQLRSLDSGSAFFPGRSQGGFDPRRDSYRPMPSSSFDPTVASGRHYDVPRSLPSSSFAQMPPLSSMSSHLHIPRRLDSIQPIAPNHAITQTADGGYVIPVLAPNDRMAMTPYQCILRESLEYFTAVDDDVNTTVQGRRKPVLPRQLGIRCRYCSHLPVAGRMRAAVYYPRSLMNLYQGAQNIASVHFQQCTEFPGDVFERLSAEKPRRDFSKVGKPYWAETCRQLGIYEEDSALWLRTPQLDLPKSISDQKKPPPDHVGV